MSRLARVLQLFLGKGEFALLPVGLSARVAASCCASDSNQRSYAYAQIAKTVTGATFQASQHRRMHSPDETPYEIVVSPQP